MGEGRRADPQPSLALGELRDSQRCKRVRRGRAGFWSGIAAHYVLFNFYYGIADFSYGIANFSYGMAIFYSDLILLARFNGTI